MPHAPVGSGEQAADPYLGMAIEAAETARGRTSPNPWVGAVVVAVDGRVFTGATEPPGERHAEIVALDAAEAASAITTTTTMITGVDAAGAVTADAAEAGGASEPAGEPATRPTVSAAEGSTLYVTLEPCSHTGRTPPCTERIIAAGVRRVVVALADPDPHVAGSGIRRLKEAGIAVELEKPTGAPARAVASGLAPYLKHRTTGLPWVVLKLAATLDGRIAAPDGSSRWITGEEARLDAHRLRALSDAVIVGAGTVRADDPELTVRTDPSPSRQPLRVVLGRVPESARVAPALEMQGDLREVLEELGRRGCLQVLVEGGARVAHDFHAAGLIDRYVVYLAPALFGGSDAKPMFDGPGVGSIGSVWRGRLVSVGRLGDDVKVELAPEGESAGHPDGSSQGGPLGVRSEDAV